MTKTFPPQLMDIQQFAPNMFKVMSACNPDTQYPIRGVDKRQGSITSAHWNVLAFNHLCKAAMLIRLKKKTTEKENK